MAKTCHEGCGYIKCSHHIGLFVAVLFVLCFVWFYVHPVEQELHLRNLRLAFFGFSGMNGVSFVLGLVQAYIWAYVGVGIWQLVGCCYKATKRGDG